MEREKFHSNDLNKPQVWTSTQNGKSGRSVDVRPELNLDTDLVSLLSVWKSRGVQTAL